MEIRITLYGTEREMENLFNEHNVRHYQKLLYGWKTIIRVPEDFVSNDIRNISEMKKALDGYFKKGGFTA